MPLDVEKPSDAPGLIIEAWAQGYMVGSLIIMAGVAVANMRQGVLLHKLIVLEVTFFLFGNLLWRVSMSTGLKMLIVDAL
jgi:hypothetical protein